MKKYYEIKDEAIEYLKAKDPLMKKLLEQFGAIKREVDEDPFTALVSSIVYQQLAYKAANSIWNRFMDNIKVLTPNNLKNISSEELRACGLSTNKVNYLKNIAEKFTTGFEEVNWNLLTDDEVIDKLITIKGVGRWTAEMFLIFCLQRENICTYNDLGLKYGLKKLYKLDDITEEQFTEITDAYAPYKTIAAFYLWELISNKDIEIDNDLNYNLTNKETGIGFMHSSIGWIKVVTNNKKVTEIDFVKYPDFKIMEVNLITLEAIEQLKDYFKGNLKIFTVGLEMKGTDFQIKVWNELLKIPYGTTISYQELAINTGNIKSSRAVGMANNKNKIAIIIPCHRVIGKNGSLTGYAGGLNIKENLLKQERNNYDNK